MTLYLVRHFPGQFTKIDSFRKHHLDFEEMCDDFETVARAWDFWKNNAENSPERVTEYETLLVELKLEITQFLENHL